MDNLEQFAAEWSAKPGGRLVTVFRAAEKITAGQHITPCGSGTEARPIRSTGEQAFGAALCDADPGKFVAVADGGPR